MNLFDLPATWSWQTLLDVAKPTKNSIADGPFGSELKISHYVEEGVPVLQGKNITNDIFRMFDIRFIADEKAEELRRSWVGPGDILMVKIGSIGYSAVIDTLDGFEKAVIPANLAKITPNSSVIDTRFIYRWLTSIDVKRHLKRSASKTAQPALSLTKIKGIPVPVPPLEEQRRIAAILDKADAIRQKRQQAIALTEELLRSAFLEMFGDPVTNPKGWEVLVLGELARVTDGTHKTPTYIDSGVPFLSAKNIRAHKIDWEDTRFISRVEHESLIRRCHPKYGDVLLTKSGTIGEVAVVDRDVEFSLFESVALLKLNNELINPIFLATLLNNPRVRFHYGGDIKGVAVKHLHLVDIKRLPVIVPPQEIQDTFLRQAGRTWEHRAKLIQASKIYENLFNSLLQRAFRGEL